MSNFIKNIMNSKIANLTPKEIHAYSKEYGFSISNEEANNITAYLKSTSIDPFTVDGRMKILKDLAYMTNPETAQKAQQLFQQIIKRNGLEAFFH